MTIPLVRKSILLHIATRSPPRAGSSIHSPPYFRPLWRPASFRLMSNSACDLIRSSRWSRWSHYRSLQPSILLTSKLQVAARISQTTIRPKVSMIKRYTTTTPHTKKQNYLPPLIYISDRTSARPWGLHWEVNTDNAGQLNLVISFKWYFYILILS